MQFTTILLAVAATAATFTSAADIVGWSGKNCNAKSIACRGIKAGKCCNFRQVDAKSVRWTLPPKSQGFGYIGSDKCHRNKRAKAVVPGEKKKFCKRYGHKLGSAKWVKKQNRMARRGSDENDDQYPGYPKKDDHSKDEDCEEPNAYGYIDDKGEEVWNDIKEGDLDTIINLFNGDDDDALKSYGEE